MYNTAWQLDNWYHVSENWLLIVLIIVILVTIYLTMVPKHFICIKCSPSVAHDVTVQIKCKKNTNPTSNA